MSGHFDTYLELRQFADVLDTSKERIRNYRSRNYLKYGTAKGRWRMNPVEIFLTSVAMEISSFIGDFDLAMDTVEKNENELIALYQIYNDHKDENLPPKFLASFNCDFDSLRSQALSAAMEEVDSEFFQDDYLILSKHDYSRFVEFYTKFVAELSSYSIHSVNLQMHAREIFMKIQIYKPDYTVDKKSIDKT